MRAWSLLVTKVLGDGFSKTAVYPVGDVVVVGMNPVCGTFWGLIDFLDIKAIKQREDAMGLVEVVMYCYSMLAETPFVPAKNTDQC